MTNKRETKFIMGLQVTSFLLKEEFQKQVVVHAFKRRKDFSLSVMKQVRIFSHDFFVPFNHVFNYQIFPSKLPI